MSFPQVAQQSSPKLGCFVAPIWGVNCVTNVEIWFFPSENLIWFDLKITKRNLHSNNWCEMFQNFWKVAQWIKTWETCLQRLCNEWKNRGKGYQGYTNEWRIRDEKLRRKVAKWMKNYTMIEKLNNLIVQWIKRVRTKDENLIWGGTFIHCATF